MSSETRKIKVNGGWEVGSSWILPENYAGQALILAHGAGAGMDHEFMCWFHEALGRAGLLSVKFNFPYIESGRRAPDPRGRLEATYRAVLAQVAEHPAAPRQIFIGGKSMGARISSYLAADGSALAGLVFLGYPLHPPGRPDRPRTDHWPRISRPCLFLQGTRDSLCRLDLLKPALQSLGGTVRLHIVEGGDHSFRVLKKSGRTQEEVRDEILDAIQGWLSEQSA